MKHSSYGMVDLEAIKSLKNNQKRMNRILEILYGKEYHRLHQKGDQGVEEEADLVYEQKEHRKLQRIARPRKEDANPVNSPEDSLEYGSSLLKEYRSRNHSRSNNTIESVGKERERFLPSISSHYHSSKKESKQSNLKVNKIKNSLIGGRQKHVVVGQRDKSVDYSYQEKEDQSFKMTPSQIRRNDLRQMQSRQIASKSLQTISLRDKYRMSIEELVAEQCQMKDLQAADKQMKRLKKRHRYLQHFDKSYFQKLNDQEMRLLE